MSSAVAGLDCAGHGCSYGSICHVLLFARFRLEPAYDFKVLTYLSFETILMGSVGAYVFDTY
jgi:hypothetical protein